MLLGFDLKKLIETKKKKVQIRLGKKDLKATKETEVFNNDIQTFMHYTPFFFFLFFFLLWAEKLEMYKCHIDIGICAKMFKVKAILFFIFFYLEKPTFYLAALLIFFIYQI